MLAASLALTAACLLSFYVWTLRQVPLSSERRFTPSAEVVASTE
jgi:hypothetical protein